MSNPSKQAGTAWESEIVKLSQAKGYKAWRLAEGGENDPGDVAIETAGGDIYIIEAKARTQMNIHAALGKAIGKAVGSDVPFVVVGVGVAWKRLVGVGGKRRVRAGPPLVAVTVDEWLELGGR